MRTTPDGIANTGTNQQQEPAIQEAGFSFAELLAGGSVEVDGAEATVKQVSTSGANEPFRKNQRKADSLEAQGVPVLSVLEGAIALVQFGNCQTCQSGSGSGQSDDPTWNSNVELGVSNRDLEPGGGHALALTYDLLGETNERQGGLVEEPDLTGPSDSEGDGGNARGARSSVPATEFSDSGTSGRPLSDPLALNHTLELPAARPVDPQPDSVSPHAPPESLQAKHSTAATLPLKAQENGNASGLAPRNNVHEPQAGPVRPGHSVAEAAGAVRQEQAQTQARAPAIAVTSDSGAAVFGVLVAKGDNHTDSEVADIPAEGAPATGAGPEQTEGRDLSERPMAELPRDRQGGSEAGSGDQHNPDRFLQPAEPGSLGPTSSTVPAFSFSSGAAPAEPQTEQVWSQLDSGAVQPDPDAMSPAQPLTSIELTSTGLERISIRVLESRGGLEVQVATQDTVAKQDLLGGLDELAGRVRELSLGTVVPGRDGPDTGQDFQRGNRQHTPLNREDWRPRAKKSGIAFALPDRLGEQAVSQPVSRS